MAGEHYKIIKKPRITEKSTLLKESDNMLVFEVDRRANKVEIKRAVEAVFKVKVLKVRTMNVTGKSKRYGRHTFKRRDWKKAVVTLAPGEKVEYFEGV